MTTTGVQAGWYADPREPGQARYFDGTSWTEHVVPLPAAEPTPAVPQDLPVQNPDPVPAAPETPAPPPVPASPLPVTAATWGSPVGPPHVAPFTPVHAGPSGGATMVGGTSYAAFSPGAQAMPGFGATGAGEAAFGMPTSGRPAQTPFAPGQPTGPVYGAPVYGAPAYAYGYGAPAPVPRRGTTPKRLLVIAGVTLLALMTLGGLMSVVRAGLGPKTASGPPLTMSMAAPRVVVSRTVSHTSEAAAVRSQLGPIMANAFRSLPGAGPSYLEVYGPDPVGAPPRGQTGEILLVWDGFAKPFDQQSFAAGAIKDARRSLANPIVLQTAEPDGGMLACFSEATMTAASTSACYWVRSGTGVIILAEFGVPVATVQQDARSMVAVMTHR